MRSLRPTPLHLAAAAVVGTLAFTGVAYAASLGLGSSKLYVWNQTLTKGTCNQTYTTAYDTYVSQATPTTSYGSAPTLTASGAGGALAYALIRFDLSGCNLPTTAGADTATLTINVTGAAGDKLSVYPVFSSWDPTTLTWNGLSGLSVGSTATTTTGTINNPKSVSVTVPGDVDAAIKAGTLWGWEIRDANGTGTTLIASSESPTNQPSLALGYEK